MDQINLVVLSKNFRAWKSAKTHDNAKWAVIYENRINALLKHLPSGSGIDAGMKFDWKNSKPEKLIFLFSYHHMNEGSYTGWTDHKLIITPSFDFEFELHITGRDKKQIKDYLYQLFHSTFNVDRTPARQAA